MPFDPHHLDEIRNRIAVSEIVGSQFPLIKKGAEYVVKGNESFTVNDKKQFWCEFGAGGDGKPHDIFDFMQTYGGCSFVEAVEELAQRAGVSLKDGPRRAAVSSDRSGNASSSEQGPSRGRTNGASHPAGDRVGESVGSAEAAGAGRETTVAGKREVVTTWDYFDPENNLLYQVVRMQERMPDGSWLQKQGKTWKTFLQRRPAGDGAWINGLDVIDRKTGQPLEFMRYKAGWLRFDADKFENWKLTERRTFEELGNVEHGLYNANAIIDELQEPKEDQRTIFIPEGEGKVDVLKEWGLLGITNSGGAKHFTQNCAEFFRNAAHVVLLQDNDRAGAERVAKLAPMLKAVNVELVQSLNFRDIWPACPMKGDVKDWRAQGGTKDQLLEIVDGLKPWTPEPYQSKFGAKTSYDLGQAVRAYPWRIKGILPMVDNVLLMGPSRSGKTFECLDMLMHVMKGEPFAGRKVVPGGYVYLTYEGATGFENRLRAYLKHHHMTPEDLHSFAWLTRPPNLFAGDDNVTALADEIVKISESFRLPLAGIVVDTHNSATRGSSEVKSDDMTKIMTNYDMVKEKAGAPLIIIGHTNAEGRHRGNEQFFNNIETAILIERVYTDAKHTQEKRDDDGHAIRRGVIKKQREGDDRTTWEFVLQSVKIGTDEDGDAIDSMVSVEPAGHVPREVANEASGTARPEGFALKGNTLGVFRSLLRAIENVGKPAPAQLGLPASVGSVITWAQLGMEYKKTDPQEQDESIDKYRNRIKARTRRFREELLPYNVIGIAEMPDPADVSDGIEKPRMINFVWPTGRRVYGRGLQWPPLPKKKPENKPILAPGESDISPDIF